MNIETNFNVGEKIYFLYDNEIYNGVIQAIIIRVYDFIQQKYIVEFFACGDRVTKELDKDSIFETPTALVDELMSNFSKTEKEDE